MNLEGRCACGNIRYRLTAAPMIVHACHCRDCQRLSGSAFAINLWIERKFVEASGGEPVPFLRNKHHAAPGTVSPTVRAL